jgi:hypothetical protein
METMTHRQGVEIAAEKQSMFMPHQGLAALNLFLDSMLTGEHGRHARLTVRKLWVTYTRMDPKHVIRRVKLTEMLSWESLFTPSRLTTCQSSKSSAGVNPQDRSAEKVKLLLNDSHLKPHAVRPQHPHGENDFE